jgi:hypothetical protein
MKIKSTRHENLVITAIDNRRASQAFGVSVQCGISILPLRELICFGLGDAGPI